MATTEQHAAVDELQHLNRLWTAPDQLGLCGCGVVESGYALVRGLLALAPFYDHHEEIAELLDPVPEHSAVHWIVLCVLDRAGLIEHGGAIGGAWLTRKGAHYLTLLQRHEYDDVEQAGMPHDGAPCERVRCAHWAASEER
jgi:hypothetical protein